MLFAKPMTIKKNYFQEIPVYKFVLICRIKIKLIINETLRIFSITKTTGWVLSKIKVMRNEIHFKFTICFFF